MGGAVTTFTPTAEELSEQVAFTCSQEVNEYMAMLMNARSSLFVEQLDVMRAFDQAKSALDANKAKMKHVDSLLSAAKSIKWNG